MEQHDLAKKISSIKFFGPLNSRITFFRRDYFLKFSLLFQSLQFNFYYTFVRFLDATSMRFNPWPFYAFEKI